MPQLHPLRVQLHPVDGFVRENEHIFFDIVLVKKLHVNVKFVHCDERRVAWAGPHAVVRVTLHEPEALKDGHGEKRMFAGQFNAWVTNTIFHCFLAGMLLNRDVGVSVWFYVFFVLDPNTVSHYIGVGPRCLTGLLDN